MAVMIPEYPNPFHPGSLEDVMFDALKGLPEAFMAFHSFRSTNVSSGMIHESETDFIIFHSEMEFCAWRPRPERFPTGTEAGCTEMDSRCVREDRLNRLPQINGNSWN